jgi:hypothetical protein
MGTRGPVPKRTELLKGHGAAKARSVTKIEALPDTKADPPSPANPKWLPEVQRLYDSLAESPMAQIFFSTDWAFAYLNCEVLNIALTSRNPTTGQLNATMISNCMANFARLGVTEGDRRRLGVELEQADSSQEETRLAIMEKYRRRLRPTDSGDGAH